MKSTLLYPPMALTRNFFRETVPLIYFVVCGKKSFKIITATTWKYGNSKYSIYFGRKKAQCYELTEFYCDDTLDTELSFFSHNSTVYINTQKEESQ